MSRIAPESPGMATPYDQRMCMAPHTAKDSSTLPPEEPHERIHRRQRFFLFLPYSYELADGSQPSPETLNCCGTIFRNDVVRQITYLDGFSIPQRQRLQVGDSEPLHTLAHQGNMINQVRDASN